jgi:ribosomal-protein-alanine N-acetyltransferase
MINNAAGYRVAPVTAEMLRPIAAMEQASFSDPWSPDSFTTLLKEPAVFFAAASEQGATDVLGYVVAWFAADEGEIANIAVQPAHRRRGVAASLLDATIVEGGRRGVSTFYLEVRESNVAARALYDSRQFEAIGRRRNYYRKPVEDAIVLRRVIEPATIQPANG